MTGTKVRPVPYVGQRTLLDLDGGVDGFAEDVGKSLVRDDGAREGWGTPVGDIAGPNSKQMLILRKNNWTPWFAWDVKLFG